MSHIYTKLTPEEDCIVQWQYGQMGDFRTSLMHTITKADIYNMVELYSVYPVEVEGYRLYSTMDGWWQETQKKAVDAGYNI